MSNTVNLELFYGPVDSEIVARAAIDMSGLQNDNSAAAWRVVVSNSTDGKLANIYLLPFKLDPAAPAERSSTVLSEDAGALRASLTDLNDSVAFVTEFDTKILHNINGADCLTARATHDGHVVGLAVVTPFDAS
jgi:hypothetical protein